MNHRPTIGRLAAAIGALLLVGCEAPAIAPGPGPADFSARLTGDYFIHRSSSHQIMISPMGWSDETPIIPPKVIECAVVRHLVLAKRQRLSRRSPHDPIDTYEEPEPGAFDYWILDTAAPEVFGPMSVDQFNVMRRELGVSESVRLKDVYSFGSRSARVARDQPAATIRPMVAGLRTA